MKIFIRLLITAIIIVATSYGIYYYLTMPDPDMTTYIMLSETTEEVEFADFNDDIITATQTLLSAQPEEFVVNNQMLSHLNVLKEALDNNFDYYFPLALSASNVSNSSQNSLHSLIEDYIKSKNDFYITVNQFNGLTESAPPLSRNNSLIVLTNNYFYYIIDYFYMLEELKLFTENYVFTESQPYSLSKLFLDVKLEYVEELIKYPFLSTIDDISTSDLPGGENNPDNNKIYAQLNEASLISEGLEVLVDRYNSQSYDNSYHFLPIYYDEIDKPFFFSKIIEDETTEDIFEQGSTEALMLDFLFGDL